MPSLSTSDVDDPDGTRSAGAGDPELSTEEIFETLKNARRRKALRYLDEAGGAATIGEIAKHIATEEHGRQITDTSSEEYKSVYVALHQTHLPKMEDVGVVEYDRDDHGVELRGRASRVFSYLRLDEDEPDDPLVDVVETPDRITVTVDLPGFDRDAVTIEADRDTLTVSAERPPVEEREDGTIVQRERPDTVERTIQLPEPIYVEDADATMEEGVLTISFAKHEGRRMIELE